MQSKQNKQKNSNSSSKGPSQKLLNDFNQLNEDIYKCVLCNYEAHSEFCWNVHCIGKKHKEAVCLYQYLYIYLCVYNFIYIY
jgi:hypothetical protein